MSASLSLPRRLPGGALTALAGPLVCGAILGMHDGLGTAFELGLGLPIILLGVAALMLPALYIGAAYLGCAPAPRDALAAAAASLTDLGILMLGLAPAAAFLIATATSALTTLFLAHALLLGSLLLTLRGLYRRLFSDRDQPWPRTLALFAPWSFVGLAIGWRFFLELLLGGAL